jgi:hypothetical protein
MICRLLPVAMYRKWLSPDSSFKCKTTTVLPVNADHNLMARHKEINAVTLFGGDIRGVLR